jgi:DNA primase
VGLGARSLDGSEPKYLNSPETPVYQKSRTLYGLSWAKEAIRRQGRIVLMEGYLDVARALEAGIEEAVATCGTALTAGHGRLLHRFAEKVALNFDQDAAGQKAARKSFDVLMDEGLRVQVVELPEGHDPDSYVKAQGAAAYRERLEAAPDAMEWLIRRAARESDTKTPAGKAAYLNALLPLLVRIESAVERAAWLPRIVETGGLDEQAAREELRRALGGRARSNPEGVSPASAPPVLAVLLPAERWLLALLTQGAEGIDEALAELTEADLTGLRSADLLRAARGLYLRAEKVSAVSLAGVVKDESARLLNEVTVQAPPPAAVGTPMDCVKELRRQPMQARLLELKKRLGAGGEGQSDDALLREMNALARQMASL